VHTRCIIIAVAMLCIAMVANAQNPEPLPGRLVGNYMVVTGGRNRINVAPVELADIKVDGEKVTGIVATYRNPSGYCVADKTPFTGTYQNGQLSIKSMPLVSRRPDAETCGGIVINVKVSAGRASGTYQTGQREGTIEFEAK